MQYQTTPVCVYIYTNRRENEALYSICIFDLLSQYNTQLRTAFSSPNFKKFQLNQHNLLLRVRKKKKKKNEKYGSYKYKLALKP